MHDDRQSKLGIHSFVWSHPESPPLVTQAPSVLSIGVFDGVHRGHRELIRRTVSDDGTVPVVLTFARNPASVMRPESYLGDLTTLEQRLSLFEELGVHYALIVDFSSAFAALSGRDFIRHVLTALPDLRGVVVGYDFHLGKGRDTHASQVAEDLGPAGVWVDIVHAQKDNEGSISSSRIRQLIRLGEVGKARALLGRAYMLDVRGGLPTTTSECRQLLPEGGFFCCEYVRQGKTLKGFAQIDNNDGTLRWEYDREAWETIRLLQRITDKECC